MNATHAPGPDTIMQMMWGASAPAVLGAGIETGLYAALSSGPLDHAALAERIKCPVRSTRILADALVALGLLTREGPKVALAPHTASHLVPGKPMYMGDFWGIVGSEMMWRGLATLAQAVKSGGTVQEQHAETPSHPFWETFAKSSASMAFPVAEAMEGILHDFIASRPAAKVLDVAAGSGIYGFTIAKKNPNAHVTLLDWPNVIPQTKAWADRVGVDQQRVSYIEGNLFEVPYGGPYDVIVLSHIYHHFDPETCIKLTKKVASALKPGGKAIIHEFVADDANPMSRLFAITMLSWTKKGDSYSADDYRQWLEGAGFTAPTVHANAGMPTAFLVADKK